MDCHLKILETAALSLGTSSSLKESPSRSLSRAGESLQSLSTIVVFCRTAFLYWRLSHGYSSKFKSVQSQKLSKEESENEVEILAKKRNPALKVTGVRAFAHDELANATDDFRDFSEERQIGQGGHGKVYMGTLPDGKQVAIEAADPASPKERMSFTLRLSS